MHDGISERLERETPPEERRLTYALVLVAVLLLGLATYLHFFADSDSGYPSGPGIIYYTGPMKAKSGVGYGTIDGQPISEAEAKAQASKWLQDFEATKNQRG